MERYGLYLSQISRTAFLVFLIAFSVGYGKLETALFSMGANSYGHNICNLACIFCRMWGVLRNKEISLQLQTQFKSLTQQPKGFEVLD